MEVYDELEKALKEIERLKEIIRQLDIKNLELTSIIKEAIEYIRQLEFESEELYDISEFARLELLNILQGSDSNE